MLDTSHVYYMGASQGGIMGGALTAISPDATQSALLVGAMNYSILLPRSVDYAPYSPLLNDAYTDELERPLLFSLIQMLWDRGEPNGYAHVMTTNPPPETPPHNVSLMIALGDHQVTNFASEVEARTVGLKAHAPVIDDGRWPDYDVLWDVPRLAASDYPVPRLVDHLPRRRADAPGPDEPVGDDRHPAAAVREHPQHARARTRTAPPAAPTPRC